MVDHDVEPPWPGAVAALLVEVVDHHEVEVRAGGEIARPEPPEPEDRETGARHGAVLGREGVAYGIEGGADHRPRDGGIGLAGLLRR